jgi:hypothetical protein
VGVQNGVEVFRQSTLVSGDPRDRINVEFSYAPSAAGEIFWTATVTDEDPDVDVATATTNVR